MSFDLLQELGVLYRGLGLGLLMAAPVGPVGLLCIRRTLQKGLLNGFATGFGAAFADTFFSAVAEWAYPLFKAESNFLKLFVKYQYYTPVFRTLTFSLTGRLGAAMGLIPIHERFFAGGSNTFRGEPFDRLGPADPTSAMPVGGKAMLLFNFELSFPLFASAPALTGAVFYDKGNVFANRKDFSFAQLEDAFGVGVRYRTPLGPLRIDFGWNVQPPTGRKQPIVFITIGNVF